MNKDDIINFAIIAGSLLLAAMMITQTNDTIVCGEEKIQLNDTRPDIVFGELSVIRCENSSSGETSIERVQPVK